jgi:hypothetical protein
LKIEKVFVNVEGPKATQNKKVKNEYKMKKKQNKNWWTNKCTEVKNLKKEKEIEMEEKLAAVQTKVEEEERDAHGINLF